jgi:hypothetical protein
LTTVSVGVDCIEGLELVANPCSAGVPHVEVAVKAASRSGKNVARNAHGLLFSGLLLVGVGALGYWQYSRSPTAVPSSSGAESEAAGRELSGPAAPGLPPIVAASTRVGKGGNELVGTWRNVQRIDAKQRVLTWETEITFEGSGQYRTRQIINGSTTIWHTGTWRREGDRVVYTRTGCKWEGTDLGREACPNVPTPPTKVLVHGDTLDLNVEKPDAPVHKFERVVS